MQSILDAPRAPSSQLKLQCLCTLSRLQLIPELTHWLEQARLYHERGHELQHSSGPYNIVWTLVALGSPLEALLDILGPGPSTAVELTGEVASLSLIGQQSRFTSFIQRVQSLEVLGKIPYGEVLRLDDLFGCTCSGFSKILRTIERVLFSLEESFPGLYVIAHPQLAEQHSLVQHILDAERTHNHILDILIDAATSLFDKTKEWTTPLECLVGNLSRFLVYHHYVLDNLEVYLSQDTKNDAWDDIFAVDSPIFSKAVAAYKSYCSNYIRVCELFEGQTFRHEAGQDPFCDILSTVLSYMSNYHATLKELLGSINPSETPNSFHTLCKTIFDFSLTADDLNEIGCAVRAMHATSILRRRVSRWNGLDPGELGSLLLDDHLFTSSTGEQVAVFLFESVFLCYRQEVVRQGQPLIIPCTYPIAPWEMGPVLRTNTHLEMELTVPVSRLSALRCYEHDSFELHWHDGLGSAIKSRIFCRLSAAQCDQWCSVLRPFVTTYYRSPDLDSGYGKELPVTSPNILPSTVPGRSARPRSWSVIGRKGPHSDTSSFVIQERLNDVGYPLSPSLLPTLFRSAGSDGPWSPRSNKSSSHLHPSDANLASLPFSIPSVSLSQSLLPEVSLPDLTGQITREENYPSAGGGFADVWKGTWERSSEDRIKVAVKALRSRIDDPDREERLKHLFHRELNLWKKLNHKHVIQLLGTAADFGHYVAMVCPWYENGCVTRYLEKHGDLLSMVDRLQLLNQIVSGLAYLHSFNIVHGDLTGSNILINDKGEACLCDFGLSSIVAEFQNSSSAMSTLGVGGSVRWADARLLIIPSESESEESIAPVLMTSNDIYSFGSVMLEILSGRIPYHYIRTDAQVVIELHRGKKPRRPADSFVTDAQWEFIKRCWGDAVEERPRVEEVCIAVKEFHKASLEYRRYTA